MTTPPGDPLAIAAAWHGAGRKVALATVIRTWRSAPCPVGSHMAIRDDGALAGSVSGGCIEAAVAEAALALLRDSGPAHQLAFGVGDELAWSVGLACGGAIEVLLEAIA